jgi:hypothetical protein
MKALSVAALVLLVSCRAAAADAERAPSQIEKATALAAAGAGPGKEKAEESRIAMPDSPNAVVLNDAPTRQRYLEAMQRYYEYRANGYAYRSRVFEWQLLSSRGIFLVVLLLVGCGIYFAWVQFRAALVLVRRVAAGEASAAGAPDPLATEVRISAKGVVVNSSVLGVIILGLSLAFFYLYLVYVYPIQNVF